jgi:hypothetical protein
MHISCTKVMVGVVEINKRTKKRFYCPKECFLSEMIGPGPNLETKTL